MTPDGFRRIITSEMDRVHGSATWLLRDPEEARDVTQEAFMRLWIDHERIAPEAARTWLLRTAYRLCVDRMRVGPDLERAGQYPFRMLRVRARSTRHLDVHVVELVGDLRVASRQPVVESDRQVRPSSRMFIVCHSLTSPRFRPEVARGASAGRSWAFAG